MKKNTLQAKISVFFLLFVVILLVFFLFATVNFSKKEGFDFVKRIFDNGRTIEHAVMSNDYSALAILGFELISASEAKEIRSLPFGGEMPPAHLPPAPPPKPFGEDFRRKLEIVHIANNLFQRAAILKVQEVEIALLDTKKSEFYIYMTVAYVFVFIPAAFLYWGILASLRPLKRLEKDIEAFGRGELAVCSEYSYNNDEIGRIQTVFFESAKKISDLMESRDIFLKNSAHELKTPIAKGIVVAHMIKEEKYREWLLEIFAKMHKIIESLMTAERIYTKDFSLHIESIEAYPIVCEIRENLFLDTEQLHIQGDSNTAMQGDRELLRIALTNLIDNAIKFSDDGTAIVVFSKNSIAIKNKGAPLQEALEKYCEPFYKETSIRNENGTGLGLYLVKKVLGIQKFELAYEHLEGWNIFTIGQNANDS